MINHTNNRANIGVLHGLIGVGVSRAVIAGCIRVAGTTLQGFHREKALFRGDFRARGFRFGLLLAPQKAKPRTHVHSHYH